MCFFSSPLEFLEGESGALKPLKDSEIKGKTEVRQRCGRTENQGFSKGGAGDKFRVEGGQGFACTARVCLCCGETVEVEGCQAEKNFNC